MIVFGADPGSDGGIAWSHGCKLDCLEFECLKRLTREELLEWIIERSGAGAMAYVEKVSASPQMGVVSAFTFGRNYERLLMAFAAGGVSVVEILPRDWQRAVGLAYPKGSSHTAHKQLSREKACAVFPAGNLGGRRITNATADALLIMRAGCLLEGRNR